jgi:hypothetical protein
MILTINGKQAALKKGSSIEYVSENRIFTDADDYSMEIELPLADCPQNQQNPQAFGVHHTGRQRVFWNRGL